MAEPPKIDVAHVATLARIHLAEDEAKLFQTQLGRVLEYADKELDTSHVEAAAHAIPLLDVFRADEPRPCLTIEQALQNAPHQANGLFLVTKVME